MGSLGTPPSVKRNKITSRSPSPNRLTTSSRPWNAATFCVEESTMSRCKSPVAMRHERGSSADTGLIRIDNVSSNGGSTDDPNITEDERDGFRSFSGYLPNGSSSELIEDTDGTKTKAAMEHVLVKIDRTKDLIRGEQTARDDNVNEYLKLASNADKNQLTRIKAVFEKKNQKYAQTISQLQKKLDGYNRRLQDLEAHGVSSHHRQPREVLRDMGQGLRNVGGNIRDGITGLSGSVMSKPREFAHLIRNKFGSADNINSLSRTGENDSVDDDRVHHGSATLPGGCSLTSSSGGGGAGAKFGASDEGSECSSVTSESNSGAAPRSHSHTHHSHAKSSSLHSNQEAHMVACAANTADSLEPIFTELRLRREEVDRLRNKLDNVKKMLTKDIETLNQALQEERFRSERLEEQINDLTELHQNEVENLKQTICDMEEKVQYQSEERLRDIHEMLEACQTKISKMEHQQAQHQQYLTLEGLDNSNARALVVKLINIVLTILQVILLLVATAAGILMPFLRTRLRVITTTVIVAAVILMMKRLPDTRAGDHFLDHLKQFLPVK